MNKTLASNLISQRSIEQEYLSKNELSYKTNNSLLAVPHCTLFSSKWQPISTWDEKLAPQQLLYDNQSCSRFATHFTESKGFLSIYSCDGTDCKWLGYTCLRTLPCLIRITLPSIQMTVAGPCHCWSVVNLQKTLSLGLNTTSQYCLTGFWTSFCMNKCFASSSIDIQILCYNRTVGASF